MAVSFSGVISLCFLGFHLMLLAPVSRASTTNRALTYFTNKKVTFNDAAELCRSRGSRLLTTDSEDVRLALKKFSENAWSSYWSFNFWIGLHKVNGKYMWQTSCAPAGNYTPWKWFSEEEEDKRCVTGDSLLEKDKFWLRRRCENALAAPICEKPAGQCAFLEYSEYEITGITPEYKPNILNLDECQQACVSDTKKPECWAVTFTGQACYFFRAQSRAEILANAENSVNGRAALFVKMCFQAQLDHTNLTVIHNDPVRDNKPWTGCAVPTIETTPEHSTEVYSGQTSSTTPAPVWSLNGTTTTVSVKQTLAATTSEVFANSVNFDTSTIYEENIAPEEGTAINHEGTTVSLRETTVNYEGTTASLMVSSASERSLRDVKWTTNSADLGELDSTSAITLIPLLGTSREVITVSESSVRERMDHQPTDGVPTTHPTNITGSQKGDWCECKCIHYVKLSEAGKREFTEKLISSLTLKKSDISSNRRRYESAHDPRPSAQKVGWLGLVLLGVALGGLVLTDFLKLYRDITCKTGQKY